MKTTPETLKRKEKKEKKEEERKRKKEEIEKKIKESKQKLIEERKERAKRRGSVRTKHQLEELEKLMSDPYFKQNRAAEKKEFYIRQAKQMEARKKFDKRREYSVKASFYRLVESDERLKNEMRKNYH